MKTRFAVPFLLLIVTPLGLLAWLGVLLASQQREAVEERLIGLMREDLRGIENRIDQLIENRERQMLSAMDDYLSGSVRIEEMGAELPTITEPFELGSDREPLYPTRGRGRDDFLDRTSDLWTDRSLFQAEEEAPERVLRAGRILDGRERFGWETWFWNRGMHFLFWRVLPDDRVLGFEVNRARLIADIVDELPDTDASSEADMNRSFQLVDSQGETLYQWGAYSPDPDASPVLSESLMGPLSSWSVAVYAPPDFLDTGSRALSSLSLWVGLLAVGLGLLAIGIFVVREYTRDLREAEQRVTFVNQVSHELKTPLTNIRMYAELLNEEISDDSPNLSKKTNIIVEESGRLSRLIGNILTFSRQERAKLKLHFTKGSLDETMRATLDHYRPSLSAKGIEVDLDLNASDEVLFDSDAVGQIVGNLLSNVEKYCPGGSKVALKTSRVRSLLILEVADDGPGIPKGERERIFRPFYRISNELTDGVTGTGIGLAISRDLARMHGGDLELAPTEKGARFQLTLQVQSIQETQGS